MHRVLWLAAACVMAIACGDDSAPPPPPDCPADPNEGQPPARADMAGAFYDGTQSLYLFGGDVGEPQACLPNPSPAADVWRYDIACKRWLRLQTSPPPMARTRAATVLEKLPNISLRMILIGGRSGGPGSALLDDIWAFDLSTFEWSQLMPTGGGPGPRQGAAAAFDSQVDQIYIFGGDASSDPAHPSPQNDLWALDLVTNEWKLQSAAAASGPTPEPRALHRMVFDRITRFLFVGFGAGSADPAGGPFFRDLYAFNAQDPTKPGLWSGGPIAANGPSGRISPGMAMDDLGNRILLFGGRDDSPLGDQNDFWILNLSNGRWGLAVAGDALADPPSAACSLPADLVTPAQGVPERRQGMLFTFGAPGIGYVYGGRGDCGNLDDVWALLIGNAWVSLTPATTGLGCPRTGGGCPAFCP